LLNYITLDLKEHIWPLGLDLQLLDQTDSGMLDILLLGMLTVGEEVVRERVSLEYLQLDQCKVLGDWLC